MKTSYEIDYHAKDIQRQLSQATGNSSAIDIMDITIRFVTEMLAANSSYRHDTSVVVIRDGNTLELMFLYSTPSCNRIIEEAYSEEQIRKFFEYYYDEISHKCSNGENRLTFRLTLLTETEMRERYFSALDKQKDKE